MKVVLVVLALLLPRGVFAEGEPVQVAAADPPLRFSGGFGVGHTYGMLGVHAEVRKVHWAAFLGVGAAAAAGVKWYSGDGSGFVLSLHASYYPTLLGLEDAQQRVITVALTAGWRIRNSDWTYIEVAVGPAYGFQRYKMIPENPREKAYYRYSSGLGALFIDIGETVFPDIGLGFGFEF